MWTKLCLVLRCFLQARSAIGPGQLPGILHWQPCWLEEESCYLEDLCLNVRFWLQPKTAGGGAGVPQNQSLKHCYDVKNLENIGGSLSGKMYVRNPMVGGSRYRLRRC